MNMLGVCRRQEFGFETPVTSNIGTVLTTHVGASFGRMMAAKIDKALATSASAHTHTYMP